MSTSHGLVNRRQPCDRGNTFASKSKRLAECANMKQSVSTAPRSDPRWVSYFSAGGAMTMMRMLAIMYVAQAVAGIAVGCVYALWLMYPA